MHLLHLTSQKSSLTLPTQRNMTISFSEHCSSLVFLLSCISGNLHSPMMLTFATGEKTQNVWLSKFPMINMNSIYLLTKQTLFRRQSHSYQKPAVLRHQSINHIHHLSWFSWPKIPIVISFMAHFVRIDSHMTLFYCQASALFRTRHCWSVHENWRCHFPCRKRHPSVSHPTHWSLVFRCFLHIHTKKPCPNPSSSLFSTKSLISL